MLPTIIMPTPADAAQLRAALRDLEDQRREGRKWFDKVQRIHAVISSTNIPSVGCGGSKPSNVFGAGAMAAINVFGRSEASAAERALMEIIEIIDEE